MLASITATFGLRMDTAFFTTLVSRASSGSISKRALSKAAAGAADLPRLALIFRVLAQ
jgi:hypothetical protein